MNVALFLALVLNLYVVLCIVSSLAIIYNIDCFAFSILTPYAIVFQPSTVKPRKFELRLFKILTNWK